MHQADNRHGIAEALGWNKDKQSISDTSDTDGYSVIDQSAWDAPMDQSNTAERSKDSEGRDASIFWTLRVRWHKKR